MFIIIYIWANKKNLTLIVIKILLKLLLIMKQKNEKGKEKNMLIKNQNTTLH